MKRSLTLCLLLGAGCVGTTEPTTEPPVDGCDVRIEPAATTSAIQSALIEVEEDGVICFSEGTWQIDTELSLSVSGVTLRGAGATASILDFSSQTVGANGLLITGDGVTVEDLAVHDTAGDGIRASSVSDITFSRVHVIWNEPESVENGAYGLYPVSCDGVVIEDSLVVGARDAGIYVGQSTNALVARNEARGNVAGIEIENTTDAEVVDNWAHNNTGGLLIFDLPGLPVSDGARTLAHRNTIENNNLPNFAEEGTIVSEVPSGTGILILAADEGEYRNNTITGNNTFGIAVLSYQDLIFGEYNDENFNIYSHDNWIHDNVITGNGEEPDGIVAGLVLAPVPGLVWDGCGDPVNPVALCQMDNGEVEYINLGLCTGFNQDRDIEPVTCEGTSLGEGQPEQ